MKKNDIIILAIIVFVAVAGLVFTVLLRENGEDLVVRITVDGEDTDNFKLTSKTEKEITIKQGDKYNIIHVHDGEVDVTDANCRDLICVNTKKAVVDGDIIVCLPHKVVVEIYAR